MNRVLFTQDITIFDCIIRALIVIGWLTLMIIDAIQRHKEKREQKRLYEEWLKRKDSLFH